MTINKYNYRKYKQYSVVVIKERSLWYDGWLGGYCTINNVEYLFVLFDILASGLRLYSIHNVLSDKVEFLQINFDNLKIIGWFNF